MAATNFIRLSCVAMIMGYSSVIYAGCDACLQSSIQSATSQMNTSLNALDGAVQSNVTATQALEQTIQASNQSLVSLMQTHTRQLLSGLDAATTRLEIADTAFTETLEKSMDHVTTSIVKALKDTHNAEAIMQNERELGGLSQTLTGKIYANRAPSLAAGMAAYETQLQEAMILFNQWATIIDKKDATSKQRENMVRFKVEELKPLLSRLDNGVLTELEVEGLLTLFRLTILPNPINVATEPSSVQLQYRRRVEKLALSYMVFVKQILSNAALIDSADWNTDYVILGVAPGTTLTSFNEFIEAETTRKMLSPEWQLDVKTRLEAGLLREQLYQGDMQNYLLNQLIQQEQESLLILSMMETK